MPTADQMDKVVFWVSVAIFVVLVYLNAHGMID